MRSALCIEHLSTFICHLFFAGTFPLSVKDSPEIILNFKNLKVSDSVTFSRSRQQTSRKLVEFLSQWMNCARGEKLAVLLAHNALQWRGNRLFWFAWHHHLLACLQKDVGGRFLQDRHQVSKWLWKSSPLAFLSLLPPLRSPPPRRADPGKGSGCDLNAFLSWNKATFWLCKSINWIWIYSQSGWKPFCREILEQLKRLEV